MQKSGHVIWVTGLSGAGKTTISECLADLLRRQGACVVLVDGDQVRRVIGDDNAGYDKKSRLMTAHRIARMAQSLASQGLVAVVATISMFHEIHAWNRENQPGFLEVYLKTELETRQRRDPKKLYKRFAKGKEKDMAGVSLKVEYPKNPDLLIINDKDRDDVTEVAESIITRLHERYPHAK